ncbi:M6 family metalloprotease domain-containing protein, partial [bacterium]
SMHKKVIYFFLFLILTHFGFSDTAFSVPAAPDIFEIRQPNGRVFQARLKGDEWNNRVETVEGYTVKKDTNGYWYYVRYFEKDIPALSNTYAHEAPLAGIRKHIRPEREFLRQLSGISQLETMIQEDVNPEEKGARVQGASGPLRAGAPLSGNILFILAEFNDVTGTYSETSFASFINNNINDYFNEASYGLVTLSQGNESFGTTNNGVVGWVSIGYNHPNNTNRQQVAKDAILAADPYIDFSTYDIDGDGYVDADELAVVVITAGYECAYGTPPGPCMWGHRSSLGSVGPPTVDGVTVGAYHGSRGGYAMFGETHNNHQATMGIMVHELGHLVFNLPDLYDTDGGSEGIGAYGVMGGGSWGKASSEIYSGATPVLPCAWSRYVLGWIDGTETLGAVTLTAPGSASANSTNTAYRLVTDPANEYFWVENRHPVGYDTGLQRWLGSGYGGGLTIWHIDKNKLNNREECAPPADCSSSHFMIAVEQADANWDLENDVNRGNETDLWYSGNIDVFNDLSNPNSDLYDGTLSKVGVTNISVPGETMTATLEAPNVTVFEDNFESGSFAGEWNTSNTGNGRVLLTLNHYPRGKYHVVMDSAVDGSYSLNELILTLDLSGKTGVLLSFFTQEFGDENHSMPASFTGSGNYDGVAISEDGNTWYRVVDLGITMTNFQYSHFEVDLDAAIASAGISYDSTFEIKFQQYDNFRTTPDGLSYYDGITFDEIQLTATESSCTDNDGDGYGNPGDVSCPNGSQTDCDDNDGLEYPNQTWYEDVDGDSYSSGSMTVQCQRPVNFYVSSELTATSGDCNDGNGAIHPGVAELCDGVDNDCNAGTTDGSGESAPDNTLQDGVCAGSKQSCTGGSWIDDYTGVSNYEATEVTCDTLDNDCDNQTDEGLTSTFYIDADGDGYGDENDTGIIACIQPDSFTANNTDCNDSDANIYPGGPPSRITGVTPAYYGSIQAAYDAAGGGNIIQGKDRVLIGDVTMNLNKVVTLEGGYNCSYSAVSGVTTIQGDMTISNGTIVIGDFVIE